MKNNIFLLLVAILASSCSSSEDKTSSENSSGAECITCEDLEVGETFTKNGVTYTVVDDELLRMAVAEGWDLEKVCTSKVTNLDDLFDRNETFNEDISKWDVSNVTSMKETFRRTSFNQPIGNWDVSQVRDMSGMFSGAGVFNQPLNNWDVSKVEKMSFMFSYAQAFNQDISGWDVSSVKDFYVMFENADVFNQDLSSWDVNSTRDDYDCRDFSKEAANWTLPKPNFTNCDCGCQ